jgi:hypothetical protein
VLEGFLYVFELGIHDGANARAAGKKELADPNFSCKILLGHQDGVFVEKRKVWNALVNGIGDGFAVLLAIRNIVIT